MEKLLEDDVVIEVPLTEEDILVLFAEMLETDSTVEWTFPTNNGKEFILRFMSEDEYDQRRK